MLLLNDIALNRIEWVVYQVIYKNSIESEESLLFIYSFFFFLVLCYGRKGRTERVMQNIPSFLAFNFPSLTVCSKEIRHFIIQDFEMAQVLTLANINPAFIDSSGGDYLLIQIRTKLQVVRIIQKFIVFEVKIIHKH